MNGIDALLAKSLGDPRPPWQKTTLRRAAVLAPIVERQGEDALLFVVRASSLRKHAGQIAFPGGAAEELDLDPAACALRETHEEVGVSPDRVALLGSLPSSTSSSNYRVHCLVGRVRGAFEPRVDSGEVERLLCVPIRELLPSERWTHERAAGPGTNGFPPSPHFRVGGDVIWGLTGRFTWALLESLRSTR